MSTSTSPAVRVVTIGAVVVVAAAAATSSFTHMRSLAVEAGEGWRAPLLPVVIDGMIVVGSMTLLTRRRDPRNISTKSTQTPWLAWMALLGGVLASLAANIASAEPTAAARMIAAAAPLAFCISFELLLQQRREAPATVTTDLVTTHQPSNGNGHHPAGDRVGEGDHLAARTRELVAAAEAEGRTIGRRALAGHLGVSEHRARALLNLVGGGDPR